VKYKTFPSSPAVPLQAEVNRFIRAKTSIFGTDLEVLQLEYVHNNYNYRHAHTFTPREL